MMNLPQISQIYSGVFCGYACDVSFLNELKRRNVLRVGAAYIVTAWLVIQVVETIFPAFGFGDAAIRYVTIAFAIGLIPALVMAWVFELTPEGLKKEEDVDHSRPASLKAARRLDRIILMVLALALGYFAFDKFVLAPQHLEEEVAEARQEGRTEALVESYGEQSIAVLAFDDMSPDGDQEYLSDGIAEEILNLLAKIPELRVISRSSAFTYKGKDVPIPRIAEELNVVHVLEGSVRKAGDRIRITAQLIEARSDTHLWSETYDRVLDDVFAIQDEVAAHVVDSLQLTLAGPVPASRRTDPEAYALILQAKQLFEMRSRVPIEDAEALIERALMLDPDYVPALEAQVWLDYLKMSDSAITQEEGDRLWKQRSARLLELDPDNGVMLSYVAWELYDIERDIEAAVSEYLRLIERHPNNAEILRVAGGFMRRTGFFEQAIEVLNRCVQVDPLKHGCTWQLKEANLWSGNLQKARELTDRLKAFWGRPPLVHDALLRLLEGNPEAARELVETWEGEGDYYHALLALAAHDLGDMDEFEARMSAFWVMEREDHHDFYIPFIAAEVNAYIGDTDAAFEWLDKATEADENEMYNNTFNPFFRKLYDDPRWDAHRERMGLSEARLGAIEFEIRFPD
jgi:TolB-like protein